MPTSVPAEVTNSQKISVKTVETQVLTAVEPKTYQTQYDDTKPSSYQKVIQQGKAGQKKSTIRSAQQAVGTRNLIKQIIIVLIFPRVVDDN